jgi:hypothetical protein
MRIFIESAKNFPALPHNHYMQTASDLLRLGRANVLCQTERAG